MNRKRGFTLIEVLAVVVILGVLTSIALPQYRKAILRAQAANALINLKTIFDSAKRSYAMSGQWPAALTDLDIKFFEADENGNVGEFQYVLDSTNKYASACRLGETGLCLKAYYKRNNVRDVYTCEYSGENAAKYQAVCESLGECSQGVCIIE